MRIFINYHQSDWAEWLSIAGFTYNNKVQSSTGHSTFMALYGYHPNMGTNLSLSGDGLVNPTRAMMKMM